MSPPRWIGEHGRPRPTRPCPTCGRVIPINRWPVARSRYQRPPRPRALSLRPRSQAVTLPAPHTAAPLEPQAQRTLASGRADRARPAVTGMLVVIRENPPTYEVTSLDHKALPDG